MVAYEDVIAYDADSTVIEPDLTYNSFDGFTQTVVPSTLTPIELDLSMCSKKFAEKLTCPIAQDPVLFTSFTTVGFV